MLVFEDAIVISLRPVSVSFAMRLRSRPGQLHHRPARPWHDESIRIGLRTLILTLLGVLTIAALFAPFRDAEAGERALPSTTLTATRNSGLLPPHLRIRSAFERRFAHQRTACHT